MCMYLPTHICMHSGLEVTKGNKITECSELEGIHKAHGVQLLSGWSIWGSHLWPHHYYHHTDNWANLRVRRVISRSSGGIKSKKGLSQCKQAAGSSVLCMQRGHKKLYVNTEHTLWGENLVMWGQSLLVLNCCMILIDVWRCHAESYWTICLFLFSS